MVIAKKFYGDENKYKLIMEATTSRILIRSQLDRS